MGQLFNFTLPFKLAVISTYNKSIKVPVTQLSSFCSYPPPSLPLKILKLCQIVGFIKAA